MCGAVVAALACAPAARAQVGMPPGFYATTMAGFATPTAFAAAPDGRIFIAEKIGRVKVFQFGSALPPRLVLDLRTRVNAWGDRGLLGIAVDSAFATNGYVYLYYTAEHNPLDQQGPKVARLTRITVNPDNTVANPIAPETVLLGSYSPPPNVKASCPAPSDYVDCIPAETGSHNGGGLRTAPDGTVWLSIGDANMGFHEPNRYRPYDERSLAGKIVRVDRNGRGVNGHPFCRNDLDLTKVCSKLWAKGFRNPFRMTLRPDGGPVVGDVGQNRWEEVDLAVAGGNYGWPCYEGNERHVSLASTSRCQQEYALEGTASASLPPLWDYAHNPAIGAAVIAGPQYTGGLYPGSYRGSIFVGDYTKGTLDRLILDSAGKLARVEPFATEWRGVDLQEMPDGRIGYILLSGTFGTIGYSVDNLPPNAGLEAQPTSGSLPVRTEFSGAPSSDPDGDPLSYEWSFGDGTANATGVNVVHTYEEAGTFTATLTVRDGRGGVDTETVTVWAGDRAPDPTITTPGDESLYRNGVPVLLRGTATDPEDGPVPDERLTWQVILHHGTHVHPLDSFTGPEGQFTPLVDHDSDSWYEIRLTAEDSQGLTATRIISLRPQTIRLTLASDPPGAVISYSGNDQPAPFTVDAAIAFRAALNAPSSLVMDGKSYGFAGWSNGGAQAQTYDVPESDTTLTAVYRLDGDPPETTITARPKQNTPFKRNTFEFVSDEPGSTFDCRIDGGAWFKCASPYQTPAQPTGWHAFTVRAVDPAGNVDQTPAGWAYNIYATL